MKKWLLIFTVSVVSQLCLSYGAPRNAYPNNPDRIWQNDQDLRDDISHKTIIISTSPPLSFSDGTNSFTSSTSTISYWKIAIHPAYYQVYIGAQFTTGGSVTGSSLYISGIDFKIDTTGSMKGYATGIVATNGGADPRHLLNPTIQSTTSISFMRANGSVWSSGTTYNFDWTGLIPRIK